MIDNVIVLGLFLLCTLQSTLCVPLDQFFELPTEGRSENTATGIGHIGESGEPGCQGIGDPIQVLGDGYSGLCVLRHGGIGLYRFQEKNGKVEFTTKKFPLNGSEVIISPFWADIVSSGVITFGRNTESKSIRKAENYVTKAFPKDPKVQPANFDEIFIATWKNVRSRSTGAQNNTFQAVIARSQSKTCVIFQYADNGINWADDINYHAQVGISIGHAATAITHSLSGTADIVNVEDGTNLIQREDNTSVLQENRGRYVYCIHANLSQPKTCTYNGIQYASGDPLMINCTSKCRCNNDGEFECEETTCPPIDGPFCQADGDPHYTTWDGNYFSYQGECEYVLAKSYPRNDFVISTDNVVCSDAYRRQKGFTCVNSVKITIRNEVPSRIRIDNGSILYFGDDKQSDSEGYYTPEDGNIVVKRTGGKIHVTLKQYGIYVKYDGDIVVQVQVSKTLKGNNTLRGLCGNYNGDRNDDTIEPIPLRNCPSEHFKKRDTSECDNSTITVNNAQTRCGVMKKTVFKHCNKVVNPEPFITNCQFDYCCTNPKERDRFVCSALSLYASVCTENGIQPSNWREYFCNVECPKGMIYLQCGPFCPQTCDNMNKICEGRCAEGCFCPSGQYLLDGKCVDSSVCTACQYNGILINDGQSVQPNCSSKCTCRNRELQCVAQSCLFNGATCLITNNLHYRTFDNNEFDFRGNCEYVLTTSCDSNDFTIFKNQTNNDTDQVTILGGGIEVVFNASSRGSVIVDGKQHTNSGDGLIVEKEGVQVIKSGGNPSVIFPKLGVKVLWDGSYRLEISVAIKWLNRLCGLCGNYNGDDEDDFMDKEGNIIVGPNEFGNSWIIGNTTGCIAVRPGTCDYSIIGVANTRCSAITDESFQHCNSLVDPNFFENNCIFDLCLCTNEKLNECFCESLGAYAAVCAAAGGALPDWREIFGCSARCPGGMIYQNCGPVCPQTCDYVNQSCVGGCSEGCFCPEGQIINKDGQCADTATCPVYCSSLHALHNGTMVCSPGKAIVNSTCTFKCDDGFELSGSNARTCTKDGNWAGTEANCLKITCPPLYAPKNGTIVCSPGEITVNSACNFRCDHGLKLSGSNTRACKKDGSWTGTEPICSEEYTNEGYEFCVGFFQNRFGLRNVPEHISPVIWVTTKESVPVKFTVSTKEGILSNNTAYPGRITYIHISTDLIVRDSTQQKDRFKGICIVTHNGKKIVVFGQNEQEASNDAYLALPSNPTPKRTVYEYITMSVLSKNLEAIDSVALVVGCEYNTTITVLPSSNINVIESDLVPLKAFYRQINISGNTFTINKYQTVYLQVRGKDITGTRIIANKPISVFSGHECANVPQEKSPCDILIEQLTPVHTWGTTFAVVLLKTRKNGDLLKVIASHNSTIVSVTGTYDNGTTFAASSFTLNSNEYKELSINENSLITSNNPIAVFQFSRSNQFDNVLNSDPFMIMVPHCEQYDYHYAVTTAPFNAALVVTTRNPPRLPYINYTNVLVPVQYFDVAMLTINNKKVDASDFLAIRYENNTVWGYGAQLVLDSGAQVVSHKNPDASWLLMVYGFSNQMSYGYTGGMKLNPACNVQNIFGHFKRAEDNKTNVIGNFSSNDQAAIFNCKVDSGSFEACISPRIWTNLHRGRHHITVQAGCPGNTGYPVQRRFIV